MDRRAWWARVHRVSKNQTRLKQLSTHAQNVQDDLSLRVLIASAKTFFPNEVPAMVLVVKM